MRIEDCEEHVVIGCADGSEYKVGNAFHCEQLVVSNYGVMKENIRNYIVFRIDGFSMHHNRQNARLRSSEKARGPRFFPVKYLKIARIRSLLNSAELKR